MARTKRIKTDLTDRDPVVHGEIPPAPPCMTAEELWKIRALSAESEIEELKIELWRIKREIYIASIDPKGELRALDDKIKGLVNNYSQKMGEYKKSISEIAANLGIHDLTRWSWDDNTGIFREIV